jgi:hypothetical protein
MKLLIPYLVIHEEYKQYSLIEINRLSKAISEILGMEIDQYGQAATRLVARDKRIYSHARGSVWDCMLQ